MIRALTLAYSWQKHLTPSLCYKKVVNVSHTLLNAALKVENRIGYMGAE